MQVAISKAIGADRLQSVKQSAHLDPRNGVTNDKPEAHHDVASRVQEPAAVAAAHGGEVDDVEPQQRHGHDGGSPHVLLAPGVPGRDARGGLVVVGGARRHRQPQDRPHEQRAGQGDGAQGHIALALAPGEDLGGEHGHHRDGGDDAEPLREKPHQTTIESGEKKKNLRKSTRLTLIARSHGGVGLRAAATGGGRPSSSKQHRRSAAAAGVFPMPPRPGEGSRARRRRRVCGEIGGIFFVFRFFF